MKLTRRQLNEITNAYLNEEKQLLTEGVLVWLGVGLVVGCVSLAASYYQAKNTKSEFGKDSGPLLNELEELLSDRYVNEDYKNDANILITKLKEGTFGSKNLLIEPKPGGGVTQTLQPSDGVQQFYFSPRDVEHLLKLCDPNSPLYDADWCEEAAAAIKNANDKYTEVENKLRTGGLKIMATGIGQYDDAMTRGDAEDKIMGAAQPVMTLASLALAIAESKGVYQQGPGEVILVSAPEAVDALFDQYGVPFTGKNANWPFVGQGGYSGALEDLKHLKRDIRHQWKKQVNKLPKVELEQPYPRRQKGSLR